MTTAISSLNLSEILSRAEARKKSLMQSAKITVIGDTEANFLPDMNKPTPERTWIEELAEVEETATAMAAATNLSFDLSDEQRWVIDEIKSGKSLCLIGKAGTGKTTTIRAAVAEIQAEYLIAPMHSVDGHKHLRAGSLGIACVAFTNRAINNIARGFDLGATQINFLTIHKLLEYIREDYGYEDKETKEWKTSSRFVPSRTAFRKLPHDLRTIIIEEASMVSIDLWSNLIAACPNHVQFVFLGDLQQLPPPYGDGILGYKLNALPVYELSKIYRQAADNPIIRLAWDISNGERLDRQTLESKYLTDKSLDAPIRISFFDKKIDYEMGAVVMGKFFCTLIDRQILSPDTDIILVPYNKKLGSIVLNKSIAQHISSKAGVPTYEIIAGFQKHYYAVGDKVLYNKKEGYITKITRNGNYIGKSPMAPSVDLHRDGSYHPKDHRGVVLTPETMSEADVDNYLLKVMESSDDEDVTNQASHVLHIDLISEQMEDGSTEAEVSTRGEYSNLELAYAITIYKAQGSEWRKVFLLLHNSHYHANRECLYTAATRASRQLFVMCESDSFSKAIGRQRIPGTTLKEKILWFKTKIEEIQRKAEKAKAAGKKLIVDEDEEE